MVSEVAAVDPVRIGQVGRSDVPVALGVLAVAGRAGREEDLPPGLDRSTFCGVE